MCTEASIGLRLVWYVDTKSWRTARWRRTLFITSVLFVPVQLFLLIAYTTVPGFAWARTVVLVITPAALIGINVSLKWSKSDPAA